MVGKSGGPIVRPPLQATKRFLRDTKKLDAAHAKALRSALENLLLGKV